MKIIKISEVLLDGGTIEQIVTDRGLFKRDNKGNIYEWNYDKGCFYPSAYSVCLKSLLAEYCQNKNNSIKINSMDKKYGWTEKKSFEQFYKEQLIRLYKKVSPFKCISFLNDKTTIEEISSEMDKLISEMGK
jgi:hypothetical protein